MSVVSNILVANESSIAFYRALIRDQNGDAVLLAAITGLTLTLRNVNDWSIINSRNLQNVLNANNVTFVSDSKTISAATNATPIVCTATAHGRSTGDALTIRGGLGMSSINNTPANPYWTITKIDADTFSLDGSCGNGTYTGGSATAKYNLLEWSMQAADNTIVGTGLGLHENEVHVARFDFTFTGGVPWRHDQLIHVRNLSF